MGYCLVLALATLGGGVPPASLALGAFFPVALMKIMCSLKRKIVTKYCELKF